MHKFRQWRERLANVLAGSIILWMSACGGGGSDPTAAGLAAGFVLTDTSVPPALPNSGKIAVLQHPLNGELAVDSAPFTWSSVSGTQSYRLVIGTQPTLRDIFDSGILGPEITSASVPALPSAPVLYARLWTQVNGVWRFSDAIFSTQSVAAAAEIVYPLDGANDFGAGKGFEWRSSPMARSYQLQIGSSSGSSDLFNGVPMRSTRRYVGGLPANKLLYGTLTTKFFDETSAVQHFSFKVTDPAVTPDDEWSAVLWAAAQVRSMASLTNEPYPNTNVVNLVQLGDARVAACTEFSRAMLDFMSQDMGLKVQARLQSVCLNPNQYDCHTLVEVLDPGTQQWRAVDPTFGLSPRRSSDGKPATALDLSTSSRAQNWNSINYDLLTDFGDAYARAYYLDYPLLFVNVYGSGPIGVGATPNVSIAGYFSPVAQLPDSGFQSYAIQCVNGVSTVQLVVDGVPTSLQCADGREGFSHVFLAGTIALGQGTIPGSFQLMKPVRNVF